MLEHRWIQEESITDILLLHLSEFCTVQKINKLIESKIGADFIINDNLVFQAKKSLKGINYKNQRELLQQFCDDNSFFGFYIIYEEEKLSFLDLNLNEINIKTIDDYIYKRRCT